MIRRGVFPLLLGLLLAGCNGGQEEAQPTPTPSPAVARPSPTPEPTPEPTPTPEPAVQRIAYISSTDGTVWIVNADGSSQTRLTDIPAFGPHWSPDGTRIAFAICEPVTPPDFGPCNDRIYVMNADGSNLTLLAEDIPSTDLDWSPDGARIAFASPDGVYIVSADGEPLLEVPAVRFIAWSPDGSSFAYVGDSGQVVLYDVASREQRSLDLAVSIDGVTAWVLGGKAILVTSNVRDCGIICLQDVSLLELESGRLTRVPALDQGELEGCARQFWLSPDGSKIVFMTRDCTMAILDFSNLEVTPIQRATLSYPSEGAPSHHLIFSPDGSQIYWADVGPGSDSTFSVTIYRAQSDGTGLTEVATLPGLLVWFSPDLMKVAYIESAGVGTLWLSDITGDGAIQIRRTRMDVGTEAWQPQP